MFCPNCGNNIQDGSKFCPYCGTPIENNTNNTNNAMFPINNTNMPVQQQIQPSMKWYKFLIYFQLFAGALVNIGSLGSVMGDKLEYEESKKQISELASYGDSYYEELFDMLGSMDVFFNICIALAVCSALLGIMAIVVRQKLAHYKKEGPKLLLIYYGLVLAINVISIAVFYICIPKEIWENTGYNLSQIYAQIVMQIVMIICNRAYFKNREYMFVN